MADPKLPESLTKLKHHYVEMSVELIDTILILHCILQDEKKVDAWLKTKNPFFGNIAPLKLFQIGKGKKVYEFARCAADEGGDFA